MTLTEEAGAEGAEEALKLALLLAERQLTPRDLEPLVAVLSTLTAHDDQTSAYRLAREGMCAAISGTEALWADASTVAALLDRLGRAKSTLAVLCASTGDTRDDAAHKRNS